jgi:hypothetical protein
VGALMGAVFDDLSLKEENIEAMTKANFSFETDPKNKVASLQYFEALLILIFATMVRMEFISGVAHRLRDASWN